MGIILRSDSDRVTNDVTGAWPWTKAYTCWTRPEYTSLLTRTMFRTLAPPINVRQLDKRMLDRAGLYGLAQGSRIERRDEISRPQGRGWSPNQRAEWPTSVRFTAAWISASPEHALLESVCPVIMLWINAACVGGCAYLNVRGLDVIDARYGSCP